jgi:hypothetical protein
VPDWLRPLLDAVLHDLQQPAPLDLAVGWTSGDGDRPGLLWLQEAQSAPELTGVPAWRGNQADALVHLADQLQEQFFPETRGAWGQARPACPGHGHPAEARVEGAVACWVCPSTGEVIGRVGALEP